MGWVRVPNSTERLADLDGRHSPCQRLAGSLHQSGGFIADPAHGVRTRRVTVPTIKDNAAVNTDDIPFAQNAGTGDAVNDLIIQGGAYAGRERLSRVARQVRIALEGGNRAAGADGRLGELIELRRPHAWPY